MHTPEQLREIVHRYVEMLSASNVDAIAALYAEDCTGEDPVGLPPHNGREALRAFYAMTAPMLSVEVSGPICVAGNEVAFPLRGTVTMGEDTKYLDAIDVFAFDDAGLITSFKAYWNPAELRDSP